MKIPSTKNQISNKSQHAAQAPALSVTQIQNPKHKGPARKPVRHFWSLKFGI